MFIVEGQGNINDGLGHFQKGTLWWFIPQKMTQKM